MKLFLSILMILPACSRSSDYFYPFIPISTIDRELSRKHHYKYELNFYYYRARHHDVKTLTGELDMLDDWDRFIESGDDIFKYGGLYVVPKNYHYITLRAI